MAGTRPTAVNLFWAIDRMKRTFAAAVQAGASVTRSGTGWRPTPGPSMTRTWRAAARSARVGAALVPDGARILTHCNAGALATAGYGTALGVIRGAVEAGKQVTVRRRRDAAVPAGRAADGLGTGARRHRHDRHHRQHGRRADAARASSTWWSSAPTGLRPTATWPTRSAPTRVAVLAREHGIPFYVAAPLSTIDLATPDGAGIPIEERPHREVTHVGPTG